MWTEEEDSDGFAGDLFGNEEEQAPEIQPTEEVYARPNAQTGPTELTIRLVGSHPLWAHHLWNASKVFASMFDQHPNLVRNKSVLELGAGGGLPSLVAAIQGANKIVITDYPDAALLDNLKHNVDANLDSALGANTVVEGYTWGTPTAKLRALVPDGYYDVIILSDLVFNHSQHHALLRTCRELLRPTTGRVYVFYTHHRPLLADRDLNFFTIARRPVSETADPDDRDTLGYGFKADHFVNERMNVMFEEDPGDENVRATVHGWQLWLP